MFYNYLKVLLWGGMGLWGKRGVLRWTGSQNTQRMKLKHGRIKTKTLTNNIGIDLSSTTIFSIYFAFNTKYRLN